MQEAEAAEARLKDGLSFAAFAAERGLKDQDFDLGTVPKSEILDAAVADAAFALKVGAVSAPIQGRFGVVIATVLKIEPEEAKSLADVTPQIRQNIATERAKAEVRSLHEKIEDERAGGASLAQVAEKLKLPVTTYDVDRSGRDQSGKLVDNIAHAGQVVSAAFATEAGVDNDPVDTDGGYIWYNVVSVTPSRDRTLAEVKDQVEASWRDDEITSRLKAKSAELLDKLKGGTPLDAVAAADGLKIETADKLTRGKPVGEHIRQSRRLRVSYREGWVRRRRGKQAKRLGRVPRDRRDRSQARRQFGRRKAHRRCGGAPGERRHLRTIRGVA